MYIIEGNKINKKWRGSREGGKGASGGSPIEVYLSVYNKFIPKFIIQMNGMRELPHEYLELCPIID